MTLSLYALCVGGKHLVRVDTAYKGKYFAMCDTVDCVPKLTVRSNKVYPYAVILVSLSVANRCARRELTGVRRSLHFGRNVLWVGELP